MNAAAKNSTVLTSVFWSYSRIKSLVGVATKDKPLVRRLILPQSKCGWRAYWCFCCIGRCVYVLIYTWKIHGACCICQYKDIISSKQGTITAEPLLTKLAHRPLLSFAVWKTPLSREIQWNWVFQKAKHDCRFYVNMNQRYLGFSFHRNEFSEWRFALVLWEENFHCWWFIYEL